MSEILSRSQVKHLAKLANLKLTLEEEEALGIDISEILNYFSQISRLNLKKIEPLTQATEIKNIMRQDKIRNKAIPTPKYFKAKILWTNWRLFYLKKK